MKNSFVFYILSTFILCPLAKADKGINKNLVDIATLSSSIQIDMKYAYKENFVGSRIDGYLSNKCYLSKPAAEKLFKVQNELKIIGYNIKIFDCFRPQRAVNHFMRWAHDLTDLKTKFEYYPEVPKNRLFEDGYIAKKSGHSRGSTVDLTLVSINSGKELDMGTPFDFFSTLSNTNNPSITKEALKNRMILKTAMEKFGFKNYSKEWWHYTLINEPFKNQYFDFVIW